MRLYNCIGIKFNNVWYIENFGSNQSLSINCSIAKKYKIIFKGKSALYSNNDKLQFPAKCIKIFYRIQNPIIYIIIEKVILINTNIKEGTNNIINKIDIVYRWLGYSNYIYLEKLQKDFVRLIYNKHIKIVEWKVCENCFTKRINQHFNTFIKIKILYINFSNILKRFHNENKYCLLMINNIKNVV